MMKCSHCKKSIEATETYCKAGPNDTVFCSRGCVYQGFKKFYTRHELNKMMSIITQSSQ